MIFATDLDEIFVFILFEEIIYLFSCDALQVDAVAVGQIMLDIAYQLQEKKSCAHCCAFVFCVAFFFV